MYLSLPSFAAFSIYLSGRDVYLSNYISSIHVSLRIFEILYQLSLDTVSIRLIFTENVTKSEIERKVG